MKNEATTPAPTTLLAIDGRLYLPAYGQHEEENILVHYYGSGDVDTIAWPNPRTEHLLEALYGARECGEMPDVAEVLLPDGTIFRIDTEESARPGVCPPAEPEADEVSNWDRQQCYDYLAHSDSYRHTGDGIHDLGLEEVRGIVRRAIAADEAAQEK